MKMILRVKNWLHDSQIPRVHLKSNTQIPNTTMLMVLKTFTMLFLMLNTRHLSTHIAMVLIRSIKPTERTIPMRSRASSISLHKTQQHCIPNGCISLLSLMLPTFPILSMKSQHNHTQFFTLSYKENKQLNRLTLPSWSQLVQH